MPRFDEMIGQLEFSWRQRVPVVLQTEKSECALACLAMVATFHGYETDLTSLRRKFPMSLSGTSLTQLMGMANTLGFITRPLRLEIADLGRLQRPCILHWRLNHFVVLVQVGAKYAVIHDPATGSSRVFFDELAKNFTGVALELTPSAIFEKTNTKEKIPIWGIFSNVKGLKSALIHVFALSIVLEVLGIIGPFYVQFIIDQVLVIHARNFLDLLAMAYIVVSLLSVLFSVLRSLVLIHLNNHLSVQFSLKVFAHLLDLPTSYFEKRHIGDISSRYGAIQSIRQTVTTHAIGVILDGIMAVGMLGVIFLYSVQLSFLVVALFGVYAVLRWAAFYPARRLMQKSIILSARVQSQFLEIIRGVPTIKQFNQQARRLSSYANLLVERNNVGIRSQYLSLLFGSAQSLLMGIGHILIIYFAALMVMHGVFAVGMLVAYASYASQFISRSDGLISAWMDFKMLGLYGERLADIMLTEKEPDLEGNYLGPDPLPALSLQRIAYRYDEAQPWILHDLDLDVLAGESIAIVGPSGSGKTTLVKILLGLLTPEQGKIYLGGVELRQLGLRRYRSHVAAVMQSDRLFAGSVADNIAFADPDAPLEEIVAAARLAGIHDEISAMTMGYETLVGDMGSTLSGGQQQRVFLARALLAKPRILVLDEATSHLDPAREEQVNAHIRALQITRIVIAHRPDTVLQCERIYRLDNGRLVEVAWEQYRQAIWQGQRPAPPSTPLAPTATGEA